MRQLLNRAAARAAVASPGWLRRRLGNCAAEARFRPAFDAALATLSRLPLAGPSEAHALDGGVEWQPVWAYLGSPQRPRFFADPPALATAAAATWPAWRQRTLELVERDRREGLPIYADRGPLLDSGFPWAGVAAGPGADVLGSVRPHRFAFAPRWALAILYGQPLAGELLGIVEAWMRHAASEDNKLAYLSNLVVIQRMLATSWAWAFVAASEPRDEACGRLGLRLLQILITDLAFLHPRLGSSHPNNHLLVDRFAQWFASAVWHEFVPNGDARCDHERLWLAEWERQILPDGSGFEHAQHYHEFACEMAVAYLALSRRNGWPVHERAIQRVHAMLRFQVDANGIGATPLAFGNGTEDPLFPLDAGEGWAGAAWADVLCSWFEPDRTPPSAGAPGRERAYWLLAEASRGEPIVRRASPAPTEASVYPDGGIVVLPDDDPATRLVLRTGPAPGRPMFAGHAHADLLSVCADVDGLPLLVDAGTFSYRGAAAPWPAGEPAWRRYFAGPMAHSGLAIAEVDPLGRLEGDFRPAALPARVELTRCHAAGTLRWVEGLVHDAGPYSGHRRGIVQVLGEYWLVYDIVPHAAAGSASFGFQAAPEATVQARDEHAVALEHDGACVTISRSAGLTNMAVASGQLTPPAGWVSRAYGCKVPAAQLRFSLEGGQDVTAFVLTAGRRPHPRQVEAMRVASGGCAFRLRFDDRSDCLLASDAAQAAWSAFDLRFCGSVAWWRSAQDGSRRLRWVDGHFLESRTHRVRTLVPGGSAMWSGRIDARGFETADGMERGGIVCESWKEGQWSPIR